jgi:hypothetical protein
MVPDLSKTSLGLEYFCTEGDELWTMPDADLIELGKREVERIGLANYADVEDGCVFRVPKAYPIYDSDYRNYLAVVKRFLGGLENLQTIGRNGLHRYNNQDHSMLTAMFAVRNLVLGEKNDLWSVNADQEYLEEVRQLKVQAASPAKVPTAKRAPVYLRLDPLAFGLSVGITAGAVLVLATLFLVIKDGDVVGPTLHLLAQVFPGYTVSLGGAILGMLYAFAVGFIVGSGSAYLRNVVIYFSLLVIRRDIQRHLLRRFLDYM